MPVLTLTAPNDVDSRALLPRLCIAVSDALGLTAHDVVGLSVQSSTTVDGAGAVAPWLLVSIHGSHRGDDAHHAARIAADESVRSWAVDDGVELGGVWVEWTLPQPDSRSTT